LPSINVKLKKIIKDPWEDRYVLDCRPGCCTRPYGLKIECNKREIDALKDSK